MLTVSRVETPISASLRRNDGAVRKGPWIKTIITTAPHIITGVLRNHSGRPTTTNAQMGVSARMRPSSGRGCFFPVQTLLRPNNSSFPQRPIHRKVSRTPLRMARKTRKTRLTSTANSHIKSPSLYSGLRSPILARDARSRRRLKHAGRPGNSSMYGVVLGLYFQRDESNPYRL